RPEIDRIDRIIRRLRANKPERDGNIVRPGLGTDGIERLEREDLRSLHPRPGRGTQPPLKLAGVYRRENVRTEAAAHQAASSTCDYHVAGHDEPSNPQPALCQSFIFLPRPLEE